MITLKQIEAVFWIVKLGTFERAAAHLHTSQSAISKRIQDLENSLNIPIFVREQRGAKLTQEGEYLLAIGEEMLTLQDRILDLKRKKNLPVRQLRLGVTEITALTWLPSFIKGLRERFTGLTIEPEVDASRDLFGRLQDEDLDIIIVPDAFSDPTISSLWVGEVSNVWAASPSLMQSQQVIPMRELTTYTVLMQGKRSGSGIYLSRWLRSQGISFPHVLTSDNLVALVGFAVAGLGITYLPKHCFDPLVRDGKLTIVETDPVLPAVPYSAMYRKDHPSDFVTAVANLTRKYCDFSQQFAG